MKRGGGMGNKRGYGRVFDDEIILEQMLKAYESGISAKALGRHYNCDHTSILYQAKKHSIRPRLIEKIIEMPPPPPQCTEEYPPLPPRKIPKYAHLIDEDFCRCGKSYKEYMKIQKERDKKVRPTRDALIERLKSEKKERDRMMKEGLIPTPNHIELPWDV